MQRPVSNTYGREKTLSLQKLQVPSTFSQFFWVKLKFVYDPLWIKAGPTILLHKPPGWNTCKLVSNWVSPFWLLRQGTRGTPQKSLDKMYIFLFKNWAQGLTIVLSQKLSSYLHSCKKAIACCILLQNNVHITKSFTSLLHCTYFEYATFTSPIMHLICAPPPPKKKMLHNLCFSFPLGITAIPRETENNAYATFWGGKQGALWEMCKWRITMENELFFILRREAVKPFFKVLPKTDDKHC